MIIEIILISAFIYIVTFAITSFLADLVFDIMEDIPYYIVRVKFHVIPVFTVLIFNLIIKNCGC